MQRPVIIVEPFSSGIELAPAFKARGIPAIAVTLPACDWVGFGTEIQSSDFIEIIPAQPNLVDLLRAYNPLAIIPGDEKGVPLAESLAAALTPERANNPQKALHRQHKAFMQQALHESGVPALKTLNSSSAEEIALWIKENQLSNSSFIIKPPISAGSDKVFHISPGGDWKQAFNQILNEPSQLTGHANETVVVQEEAVGTEFAVGTVSANGKHYLTHLIKYNKATFNNRKTIYDHVEFVPYTEQEYGELFDYTKKALDALGVRWGAAHNEIMLTSKGPRLIETGARMCGGPVVRFAREATGSSQADKLVEIYTDGDVLNPEYVFKKTVIPVFLKSYAHGAISNIEVFSDIEQLPTFFSKHIWFKNGDVVPQTVDYLTSLGIIALSGDKESIVKDYAAIRHIESKLQIKSEEKELTALSR